MNRKYGLSIVFVLAACSLLKEEAFKLNYNQRKVIDTIGKVELKSLQSDGSWTPENYSSFLFDGDLLVANVSKIVGSSKISEKYAVEVIKDVSDLQGVYRLHGNGQYGGMYLGIKAITNSSGAFAKIAIQNTSDNILDKVHNIHYWV